MTLSSRRCWIGAAGLVIGLVVSNSGSAGEIHDAVRLNDLKTVETLLAGDPALLQSRDENQVTPLHEAVRYGDIELVRLLIARGADVNSQCYNQFRPLHLTSDPEIARLLVQQGADLQARAATGTPLEYAISDQNNNLIDYYLSAGCKLSFENLVDLGRVADVERALQAEPWLAKPPRQVLHSAASSGNLPLVSLLLAHGADPNQDYGFSNVFGIYSPLSAAVGSGKFEVAELLCQRGARVDVSGGKFYDNLLHEAVAHGDARFVRLLLQHGANVNAPLGGFSPMSPLHVAANQGDVEKCRLLLDSGADVNALTPDGASPLDFAAVWRYQPACELLLSRGAKLGFHAACLLGRVQDVQRMLLADPHLVKEPDRRLRRTPLHWAAASGSLELARVLIQSGADVNAKAPSYGQASNVVTGPKIHGADHPDEEGETPLHVAAAAGRADVIELLLDNRASINVTDENQASPLDHAVSAGSVDAVRVLLQRGALVETNGRSCLTSAWNNLEITRLLLATQPAQRWLDEALSISADSHPEVARELIAAGAQADIFAACTLGLNARIQELLEADARRANLQQREYPRDRPLFLAAAKGHVQAVTLLLGKGAEVEPRDESSPLQAAAAAGHLAVMDVLLAFGAKVNHKDIMGQSPIQLAAERGQLAAVQWLLGHGADPLIRDVSHDTPLHDAAGSGALDIVRLLAAAGVPVNSVNKYGETPLHRAVENGRLEATDLLLQLGADLNARNRRGETPLNYAEREDDPRWSFGETVNRGPVADLLRSGGARK